MNSGNVIKMKTRNRSTAENDCNLFPLFTWWALSLLIFIADLAVYMRFLWVSCNSYTLCLVFTQHFTNVLQGIFLKNLQWQSTQPTRQYWMGWLFMITRNDWRKLASGLWMLGKNAGGWEDDRKSREEEEKSKGEGGVGNVQMKRN